MIPLPLHTRLPNTQRKLSFSQLQEGGVDFRARRKATLTPPPANNETTYKINYCTVTILLIVVKVLLIFLNKTK